MLISILNRLAAKTMLLIFIAASSFNNSVAAARAESHATILLYHHVSSQTPPSTSIATAQFKTHLEYLHDNHVVLPLTQIIEALKNDKALPDKAVAITFDDGYRNILDNGHPLLQALNMPYTIFISPTLIGKQAGQLTWDEVKSMATQGVTFANHTSYHDHLLARQEDESQTQWLKRVVQDIEFAETQLEQQLGYSLKYLAYPYGEYNLMLKNELEKNGFTGFGQQSGGVSSYSDFGALPRFPAAGVYANLNSLKTKMASLAMPVTSPPIEPLRQIDEQPTITLTLDSSQVKPARINCFYNNQPLELQRSQSAFSFTIPEPLKAGRTRVNCTAPSGQKGRFHWFSQAFVIPTADGVFLD